MSTPVVGLDPSLTGLGLATPEGTFTITSKPATDVTGRAERLVTMLDKVAGLIGEEVSLVVIEGPAYSRQLGAGHHLSAGLWWLLAADLTYRGHQVIEVPPTTLKKFATGKGNASKEDMVAAARLRGHAPADDNEADALAILHWAIHNYDDGQEV